jgi:death-on-curing protein
MDEYRFLTLEEVLELHEMQLERYGGALGIRDSGLLESAVMMAQASFGGAYVHTDIYEMAAAYAFHIAENQPFIDGNKRTALSAALVFLDWHRIELNDSDDELYDAMIHLAQKKVDKAGLARLFQKLAKFAQNTERSDNV